MSANSRLTIAVRALTWMALAEREGAGLARPAGPVTLLDVENALGPEEAGLAAGRACRLVFEIGP